jgi:hypothetical protein
MLFAVKVLLECIGEIFGVLIAKFVCHSLLFMFLCLTTLLICGLRRLLVFWLLGEYDFFILKYIFDIFQNIKKLKLKICTYIFTS